MIHNHEFNDTYKVSSKYLLSYTIRCDVWREDQIKLLKKNFRKRVDELDKLNFEKIISIIYDKLKSENINFLEIKLEDSRNSEKSFCCIYNGNVQYYTKSKKIDDFEKEIVVIYRNYLEIKYINNDISDIRPRETKKLVDNFSTESIMELNKIMQKSLTNNEKKLCQYYLLFYKKNIDFSKKYTSIEIHAMLYLLERYGIKIISNSLDKTQSELALDMVNKLYSIGKIDEISNPVDLSYNDVVKAQKIGKIVRKYTEKLKNKMDFFDATCVTLDDGNIKEGTEKKVAKDFRCNIKDVKSAYRLVNIIDDKIN